MCGIAGIFALGSALVPEEPLRRMNAAMIHRGPDDEGLFCDGRAGLGMRRLSIIGLANGHQPIFSEDGSVVVVMNGEIYNYRELKQQLQERGHRFSTDSDGEVAVHLYEEKGSAFAEDLRGMFAFALYDRLRRTLLLVRDRLGKKPLYYARRGGIVLFASEIKALHASGLLPKAMNRKAVDTYLSQGYVAGDETLFEQVYRLPAGCLLSVSGGRLERRRYWDLPRPAPAVAPSPTDAARAVRRLLEEAVAVRLMSEVPLGAFLSGGIDSSAVVGVMSRQLDAPVQTFSVGFDDVQLDELSGARELAHHFHTDHHEVVVRSCDPELLRQINWHSDEPAADPAAVPTFCLSKFARQRVTVVLTGEGGDELFAGYRHYRQHRRLLDLERRLPGLRAAARSAAVLAPQLGQLGQRRWWKALWLAGLPATQLSRAWLSAFTEAELRRLYNPEFARADCNGHQDAAFAPYEEEARELDPVAQAMYLDTKLHLADQLLMKVDKMTMAASLEARCPFLDQKLVEYVAALPTAMKLPARGSKLILRDAVRDLLPAAVLSRPKQGFEPPIRRWLLGDLAPLAEEVLLHSAAALGEILDLAAVRSLWASLRQRSDDVLARQCWILLNLATWQQLHWQEPERTAACL